MVYFILVTDVTYLLTVCVLNCHLLFCKSVQHTKLFAYSITER